jgi:1,4-dihydroxy-2-naphthoyl-CoA hydrolase
MDLPSRKEGRLEFFIEELSAEHAISRMPVTDGLRNPFGVVQAGALVWMADVTASALALGKTQASTGEKGFPLAINLSSSFLGNVTSGEIMAEARFVKRGRRISVIRTRVTCGEKLLAEVTTTHMPA